MPAKQMVYDQEARERILSGACKLARAVKCTLGPRGRLAVLDKGYGSPKITKDGVTVAEDIELKNKFEDLGAKLVKEAASKTGDDAGDGTTTATVLAEAIATEGLKYVVAGYDSTALRRGLEKACEAVVADLKKHSRDVRGSRDIQAIATVAANGDAEIGKMIADAMDKVGKAGVVTVEEGRGAETTVDVVEGMQFDRGYLSPQFITDEETMTCVLEDCLVLIYEKKLSSATGLVQLLEKVAQKNKPLLIISEDVEGEALATLVVNKLRGVIKCAAVKAPGYGDRRKAMMEDIAILTGGKPIFESLGVKIENVELSEMGTAGKVTITDDTTTIVKGGGAEADIKARCAQIKREIEETTSDYDREKLQERLAKLSGGVAQINVGAATETEMKEKKARVEDALNATKAAAEEGVLPGGGVALLRAAAVLDKDAKGTDAYAAAARILQKALAAPLIAIAENAGMDGEVAARKVLASSNYNFGYDANALEFCDLMEKGIIDATKVTRMALENAVSVAGIILTTECLVTEVPKKKKKAAAGRPGHSHGMGGPPGGGMGDMDF
jgi:chaperonin GroEL